MSFTSAIQSKQRYSHSKDASSSLGPAPQDIYSLDKEIERLKDTNHNQTHSNRKIFGQSQILEAKEAIKEGESCDLQLSPNITPNELLEIVKQLGFENYKLSKLFRDSSIVLKNVIDNYVKSLHSQYQTLSTLKDEIANENNDWKTGQCSEYLNALGYLFHCKQVTPLQCDSKNMTAKVRISLNLNFENTVDNDTQFIGKFRNELATNVLKCKAENIQVLNVRAGSVVVVIGGISLIALAFAGLITLAVAIRYDRNRNNGNSPQRSSKFSLSSHSKSKSKSKFKTSTSTTVLLDENKEDDSLVAGPTASSNSILKENEFKINEKNENNENKDENDLPTCKDEFNDKNEMSKKRSESPPNFVTSLFSKLKVGIDNLTHAPKSKTHSKHAKDSKNSLDIENIQNIQVGQDSGDEDGTKRRNTNDASGYDGSGGSFDASVSVKEYQEEPKPEFLDEMDQNGDATDNTDKRDKTKEDKFGENSELVLEDINLEDESDDKKELLRLNIEDNVWVKRNGNKLYAATVIGLTRTNVVVEYDNKPFMFMNTETFTLDDPRLMLREPGLVEHCIEGCVEIDSKQGGFIKIFQNGERNEHMNENKNDKHGYYSYLLPNSRFGINSKMYNSGYDRPSADI